MKHSLLLEQQASALNLAKQSSPLDLGRTAFTAAKSTRKELDLIWGTLLPCR